jgi:ComF family protein
LRIDIPSCLPSLCAVCHGWGRARVCEACIRRFAAPVPRCGRCALRVPAAGLTCGRCLAAPPTFDRAIAAVDYAHPWGGLLVDLKFHGALDLAGALAARLRHAVAQAAGPPPALLLPVPLSTARLRERGFNQAWELARRMGMPARTDVVLRTRDTPRQADLPLADRAANLRGAFAVRPERRACVAGHRIGIVDDVLTSGATAQALAAALRQAGAAEVQVWAVARTPAPAD